jgi:signal transduction histidine kinase
LRLLDDVDVARRIELAVADLDSTIKRIRSTIFALDAPAGPAGRSLRREVLEVTSEMRPALGFDPRVSFEGPVDTVTGDRLVDEVVTVVREALSNVARHAHADRVDLRVDVNGDALVVEVTDNGTGLPAETSTTGQGLRNLQVRADRLGGTFSARSGVERGVTLEWCVPLPS